MARKSKPLTRPTPEAAERKDVPADHEKIAALAYLHWQDRGCPLGSPEEDWLAAERELQTAGVEFASK